MHLIHNRIVSKSCAIVECLFSNSGQRSDADTRCVSIAVRHQLGAARVGPNSGALRFVVCKRGQGEAGIRFLGRQLRGHRQASLHRVEESAAFRWQLTSHLRHRVDGKRRNEQECRNEKCAAHIHIR